MGWITPADVAMNRNVVTPEQVWNIAQAISPYDDGINGLRHDRTPDKLIRER
jgi:hypothetical protein